MTYRIAIAEEPYQEARIYKTCSGCKWTSDGSPQEFDICPKCGSRSSDSSTMLCQRGGISYHGDKNRFFIWTGETEGTAHVYSCDVRNILIFLARHYREWSIDKMPGRN